MKNKKILLIVSGSIAAYKAASLASFLSKENTVKVMMTKNATQFITPLTFETLTKQTVLSDLWYNTEYDIIPHIHYPQEYDFIIVAPATANLIGKVANGLADDLPSTTLLAATKPVFFVPTMNEKMFLNPAVQLNLIKLKILKHYVIQPDKGELACGCNGIGKFPNITKIIDTIEKEIK